MNSGMTSECERRKTMELRKAMLWIGVPALGIAMAASAAPGTQQQQQQKQMKQDRVHQMDQDKMQQMSKADMQRCAEMHGMDSSSMNMSDPDVRQTMQKCMQTMHGGKMKGGQMMGGQMHNGEN